MVKHVVLAAALLSAAAAPALAQDALPTLGGEQEVVLHHEYGFESRLGLYFRTSTIDGTIDHDIPVDYDDLFGSGVGAMVEASFLWLIAPGFQSGFYVSLGHDIYDGEKDVDPFGDSLKADDMEITTIIFGYKGVFPIHPFWHAEFHAGLGVAWYEKVDGTLTIGGVPADVTVFEDSSGIAWDMGGRFGFNQPHFFVEAGFGMRFLDDPQEGDIDFNGEGPFQFAFEIGGGFRF